MNVLTSRPVHPERAHTVPDRRAAATRQSRPWQYWRRRPSSRKLRRLSTARKENTVGKPQRTREIRRPRPVQYSNRRPVPITRRHRDSLSADLLPCRTSHQRRHGTESRLSGGRLRFSCARSKYSWRDGLTILYRPLLSKRSTSILVKCCDIFQRIFICFSTSLGELSRFFLCLSFKVLQSTIHFGCVHVWSY